LQTCFASEIVRYVQARSAPPFLREISLPVTYGELLTHLGFAAERDPFKSVNAADEREFLPEYFVSPPFFESVWGNSRSPKSCIVFAPTGAGKTAQVIMMQERAAKTEDPRVLTILYDDFERQGITSLEDAKLEDHLRALTRLGVVALLKTIGTQVSLPSISFSVSEREEIQYIASKYLGGANEEALAASLRSIRSPLQKFADMIEYVSASIPPIAAAMKFLGMDPASVTLLGLQAAAKSLKSTGSVYHEPAASVARIEWYDFERCMRQLRRFYSAVYILVDKVDETSYTRRNAESAFSMISVLLTNLALLNPDNSAWGFKFFLWDGVQPHYAQHGRTDRIETHGLKWTADQLAAMLDERVKYYSSQRFLKFVDLFDVTEAHLKSINLNELLMLFSNGSPRDSIRMMQKILHHYLESLNRSGAEIATSPSKIPFDAVCGGISSFSEERFAELVALPGARRQMEVIHQVCLTSTTFTTGMQKMSTNAANSKIKSWKQMGAIEQIGDIMMNRIGKPNRLYAFSDPRIALCASGLSVQNFVMEKIGRCSHCNSIQIRDWGSGQQHGQCSVCQALLESQGDPGWEPSTQLLRDVRREIVSVLPDVSYVELIVDDLGFSIEELRAEKYVSVEMMWKWAINRAIDSGPEEVRRLVDEVLERVPEGKKSENLNKLRIDAAAAAKNRRL
jgi:hypothetical protein